MKNTGKKMTKAEKEMQKLMKQVQKKVKHKIATPEEEIPRRARYIDAAGERDWEVSDVDADTLFREMKRRDF
jgi:mRNA-degrading endonuclease RelE of RelBE toxin-antitoxin system